MGGGGQLLSYIIANDNPYNIYRIYTSNLTTNHTKDIQTNQSTNTTQNSQIKYSTTESNHTAKSTNTDKQDMQIIESQNNINNLAIESQPTKDIHQTKETLTPKHIDYIIFLDSDDYWKLNCIEECVKHSNGVDIVWFDCDVFYDRMERRKDDKTIQQIYADSCDSVLTQKEWLQIFINSSEIYFAAAWPFLINFSFLKHIQLGFVNYAIYEDVNFGSLLFLQSKNIYILKQKLHYYRVRPNSITNSNQDTKIPPYIAHIHSVFKDKKITRKYHECSSWFLMLLEFMEVLDSNKINISGKAKQKFLFPYIEPSCNLLSFRHDPLNLIPKLIIIEPYLDKKFKWRDRLRIKNPKKYNRLKPLFAIYDSIKLVEKCVREISHIKTLRNKIMQKF